MNGMVLCSLRLFETPWTVALQAPLSMGFSRQEYWSGLPFSPHEWDYWSYKREWHRPLDSLSAFWPKKA